MQYYLLLLLCLVIFNIFSSYGIPSNHPRNTKLHQHSSHSKRRNGINRNLLSLRSGLSSIIGSQIQTSSSSQSEYQWNHPSLQEIQQIQYAISYAHVLPAEEVLETMNVSLYHGLSSIECSKRLSLLGANTLQDAKKVTLLQQILEQFDDRLVQVLLGVALLSAILASFETSLEAYIEPVVIIMILAINALVGVYQSSSAAESLDALKKLQAHTATVLRDSQWLTDLPISSLVPGDIISLKVGDRVPADARILEIKTSSLYADEASLTGESTVVMKIKNVIDEVEATISSKANIVFSGTIITAGSCVAVVIGTGEKSEMGKIDAGVQTAKEHQPKTPLQVKLDEFGQQLAVMISIICVATWLINIPNFDNPVFGSVWKGGLHYLNIAVALGVAAIPEGLPAVITLCLSLGTMRMARQQVIVRKLPSVETLGCTTVICTDKTGTLTTGQMTVTTLLTFADSDKHHHHRSHDHIRVQERHIEGVSYDPIGEVENGIALKDSSLIHDIIMIASLCNEAKIIYHPIEHHYDRIGEPTEAACKVLAEKLGAYAYPTSSHHLNDHHQVNHAELVSYVSDKLDSKYHRIAQLDFNRDRKSMGMLVKGPDRHQLLVKGAAEMVVKRCNRMKLSDGRVITISDDVRKMIYDTIMQTAARPLRCLALAYKDVHEYHNTALKGLVNVVDSASASSYGILKDPQQFVEIEDDMVLVGLCGIKDPARPEVRPAINSCRQAGIRVMMITGDSKETAVSIAKDVGIFDGSEDISSCAFTGQEFFHLPVERQLQLLKASNKVFCRTEPQDKQRLISMLQENLDEVVAMTGDGVNDAPALQQASIGVAMGITGTDAAKNAADMILADDNFASIVKAVEEGRNIFYNMQTFCCFLISSNIGEIILMAGAAICGFPVPLLPLHLLWVNLVTDGPPATALGFNPADPHVMTQPPRAKHESLLSKWMLIRYIITGAYVGFAAMSCYVSWFQQQGFTWMQLRSWASCDDWNSIFLRPRLSASVAQLDCSIFSRPQALLKPQSMALAALVCMEMLKALSAVSLDQSILTVPPWRNPWLLLAVAIPSLLHVVVMYVPFLSNIFRIAPLTPADWKLVLKLSLPIIVVEEVLKLIGRRLMKQGRRRNNVASTQSSTF